MTGEDYYAEALTWVGTPFHWQAALKGVGCDCKGLVWGAAGALGLPEADDPCMAVRDYSYQAPIPVGQLRDGLEATLKRVDSPVIGDVLLLCPGGRPQHLAIFGGDHIVHTYQSAGKVKRTSTAGALRAWPLDSIWRFASLGGC